MTDFESYLIRQRGFTAKSARNHVANLRAMENLIGSSVGGSDREREFRRRARNTMSPDEISDCLFAMRAYAAYASPHNV